MEKTNDKNKIVSCNCEAIHEDIIAAVRKDMPVDEKLYDLAEFFKVFGDTTRIKILYVLMKSEMCVCDIAAILGMTQSAISHQLRFLKQSRLVKYRKEGKTVFYSLDDEHVDTIFNMGLVHLEER